jgi:hypothetical protein
MPGRGNMFRISVLTIALALAAAATARAQQMPPQPPPVASPMSQGNPQERAACHPDVNKFCQLQLEVNPNDVLGILGCLQSNRAKISSACQQVLASHGQ